MAAGALTLTRFQMARLLGTDVPTWSTYEAGLARIPADQALKLSAYGIPLEWIYDGRMTNLHLAVGGLLLITLVVRRSEFPLRKVALATDAMAG